MRIARTIRDILNIYGMESPISDTHYNALKVYRTKGNVINVSDEISPRRHKVHSFIFHKHTPVATSINLSRSTKDLDGRFTAQAAASSDI